MGEFQFTDVRQALTVGRKAVAQQDWPLAMAALGHVLVLEPKRAEVYPLLMQAAMAAKNYQLAATLLIQATEHAPSAVPELLPYLSKLPAGRTRRTRTATPKAGPDDRMVYQIKVTLRYSQPPIWRRVLVAPDVTLAKLHRILQAVMGWHNAHLHEFETPDGERYGPPAANHADAFIVPRRSEQRVKLQQVLAQEKPRLTYVYDFGDQWEHDLVLEKIVPADPAQRYPVCTAGKRATPPEDVGGIPGYETFLEALADPEHEDHEMYAEWIEGDFDPAAFDLKAVNARLARVR